MGFVRCRKRTRRMDQIHGDEIHPAKIGEPQSPNVVSRKRFRCVAYPQPKKWAKEGETWWGERTREPPRGIRHPNRAPAGKPRTSLLGKSKTNPNLGPGARSAREYAHPTQFKCSTGAKKANSPASLIQLPPPCRIPLDPKASHRFPRAPATCCYLLRTARKLQGDHPVVA